MNKMRYECQICKNTVEKRPPEWCPKCGGHRIIFKRLTADNKDFAIAS